MTILVETLGGAAAILTTGAFVPQVVQTVRTRSAADFSFLWLWSFLTGLMCWLAYGILITSWPIILSNVVTQSFVLTILLIKLGAFRRRAAAAEARPKT